MACCVENYAKYNTKARTNQNKIVTHLEQLKSIECLIKKIIQFSNIAAAVSSNYILLDLR